MAMCRKHADKTYLQLVDECETFDPVSAARNYNFDMWLSTDPIGKQFTAVITEMRRLVFSVLPDHAARHLKWWKEQCATHGWTFKAYCTDPPYVLRASRVTKAYRTTGQESKLCLKIFS